MKEQIVDSLKKLGLSTYESLAYISLNSMISGKAVEVSENSTVPRTKIYDVLNRLNQKGYVEIKKGRPNIYTVVSPHQIIKKEKEKLIEEITNSELELEYNYENQISAIQAPVWLIRGREKIINKELELISRANETVNMRIGFLFKGELKKLIEAFNKKTDININIIASKRCCISKEIKALNGLNNKNVNIYQGNIPPVKLILKDQRELIHIYSKFTKDDKIIESTSIGVWNRYEDVAKNYDERFLKTISKQKPIIINKLKTKQNKTLLNQ